MIVLLFLSFVLYAGADTCEQGWTPFYCHCYTIGLGYRTYEKAASDCAWDDAYLLSVHNEGEYDFVTRDLFKNSTADDFWIGMKRQGGSSWVNDDNSPDEFSAWLLSQPNDGQFNNCAIYTHEMVPGYSSPWVGYRNVPCDDKNHYVCKTFRYKPTFELEPHDTSATLRVDYGWSSQHCLEKVTLLNKASHSSIELDGLYQGEVTYTIKDLEPNTIYEYLLVIDNKPKEGQRVEFRTKH